MLQVKVPIIRIILKEGHRYLFAFLLLLVACKENWEDSRTYNDREWWHYQGDHGRNQYSPLDQINVENVGQLQVAWTYHSGDHSPEGRIQIQCNPLIVRGILYGTTPTLGLVTCA
jgi:quinoprotein glucose dehydrogenase